MMALSLIILFFAGIILIPIAIYTWLVFPNIDGVAQDLSWFKYDKDSQHYLYWTGFWTIMIFSGYGGTKVINKNKS